MYYVYSLFYNDKECASKSTYFVDQNRSENHTPWAPHIPVQGI